MGQYSNFEKNMDDFWEEYEKDHPVSAVLQVRLGGDMIYQKNSGMANYEKNIPFSSDAIFSFYSISKAFCGIGLMKLWDDGLVNLDDHPSVYVPEAVKLHPKLTIRHLLHHVSGLPDFAQTREFAQKYAPGDYQSLREHLLLIGDYPQLFQPGTKFCYSNINYIIPSLIIENITGRDYGAYMRREVFDPLGLSEAAQIDLPGLSVPNRVQGYHLEKEQLVPVERTTMWMRGAGDIIGTADDVYSLNLAIKQRRLLSSEAWNAILTPYPVGGAGIGCFIGKWAGKTKIQHNGGSDGFRTLHIQLLQDDFDLILLSNFGFGDIRNDVMEWVRSFLGDDIPRKLIEMDKGYI